MLASQLLELIDGLPLIFCRTVFYTSSYIFDYSAAAAVKHSLAADPPTRPPATIESLDRGSSRQTQRPLGPELKD
jgi:hypothetical protein